MKTDEGWEYARDIPDTRDPSCRLLNSTIEGLPSASIIIIFRNESGINLARTVHSVLRRTPKKILDEIVLVDDNGDLDTEDIYTLNNELTRKVQFDLFVY